MKALPTLWMLILAALGTTGCGGGAATAEAAELPDGETVHLSFELAIDGIKLAVPVVGVSSLGTKTNVLEVRDGDDRTPDKTGGTTSASNIVLERGYTATDDLWEWRREVEAGTIVRRNGTITVKNAKGDTVAKYDFFEAWPSEWNVGLVNTSSKELTETVTIVCESLQRIDP